MAHDDSVWDTSVALRGWARADADGTTLIWAVSCPSVWLCVAGDQAGDLLSSTNPTAGVGAWQKAAVGQGGIGVVSCGSVNVCVAGDGSGQLLTSADPTGGPGTWNVTGSNPGH